MQLHKTSSKWSIDVTSAAKDVNTSKVYSFSLNTWLLTSFVYAHLQWYLDPRYVLSIQVVFYLYGFPIRFPDNSTFFQFVCCPMVFNSLLSTFHPLSGSFVDIRSVMKMCDSIWIKQFFLYNTYLYKTWIFTLWSQKENANKKISEKVGQLVYDLELFKSKII